MEHEERRLLPGREVRAFGMVAVVGRRVPCASSVGPDNFLSDHRPPEAYDLSREEAASRSCLFVSQ